MVLAGLDLGALVIVAAVALMTGARWAAYGLSLFGAAWLPLNNGHLEGPVLLTLDARHGLTAMDLFAYGGLVIAVVVLALGGPGRRRRAIVGSISVVLVGLAVSYVVQPG